MTSTIKPQGEGYTPITDGNSGPLHYLSARQLLTAWRKQLSGYQPGDENWTEQDQQAFDAIYDGSLFGDDVVTLTDTVKPKAEQGLFARIKKSSKYYSQGLNTKGQPCVFPVRIRQPRSSGDWPVKGGVGGQYRLTDVVLFWRDNNGHFVKIKG